VKWGDVKRMLGTGATIEEVDREIREAISRGENSGDTILIIS
jgi:hypothetical protein